MGIFFICYGFTQSLSGFAIKLVTRCANCYGMAIAGTFMCIAITAISLGVDFTDNYYLCCACALLWGWTHAFNRSVVNSLFTIKFHNDMDMFGISYFIFALTYAAFAPILGQLMDVSFHAALGLLIVIFIYLAWKTCQLRQESI